MHRNYSESTPGCVTNMVQSLGWKSLQHRRFVGRLSMLFKIQHGLVDDSPEFVQLRDSRTRGSQCLRQLQATTILLLSLYDQRLEPTTYSRHQPPDTPGIQGTPCPPASFTPTTLLNPQQRVHSFNWGHGEFYMFLSGIAVFYTGYAMICEDFHT